MPELTAVNFLRRVDPLITTIETQMNFLRPAAVLAALTPLPACSLMYSPTIEPEDVIPLLNSGDVKHFGTSHAGVFSLTTKDGRHFHLLAKDLTTTDPEALLSECSACETTSYWIE